MTRLQPTPGQTIGPFFHYALPFDQDAHLVPSGRVEAIRLHGRVLDGEGQPVTDALVEIWQADADGSVPQEPGSRHRDGWTFTGWGRSATDDSGRYCFTTVAPGATQGGSAPFFAVAVFARGLLDRLLTRAYLPDHPSLADDLLLASVDAERRGTLVAQADPAGYCFDIRLQGDSETVFLTYLGHSAAD